MPTWAASQRAFAIAPAAVLAACLALAAAVAVLLLLTRRGFPPANSDPRARWIGAAAGTVTALALTWLTASPSPAAVTAWVAGGIAGQLAGAIAAERAAAPAGFGRSLPAGAPGPLGRAATPLTRVSYLAAGLAALLALVWQVAEPSSEDRLVWQIVLLAAAITNVLAGGRVTQRLGQTPRGGVRAAGYCLTLAALLLSAEAVVCLDTAGPAGLYVATMAVAFMAAGAAAATWLSMQVAKARLPSDPVPGAAQRR